MKTFDSYLEKRLNTSLVRINIFIVSHHNTEVQVNIKENVYDGEYDRQHHY